MSRKATIRGFVGALLVGVVLISALSAPADGPAYAVSYSTPPITASHDGYVRGNNNNYASEADIGLKNAHPTVVTNNRFGYARFEYDPDYVWPSALRPKLISKN